MAGIPEEEKEDQWIERESVRGLFIHIIEKERKISHSRLFEVGIHDKLDTGILITRGPGL